MSSKTNPRESASQSQMAQAGGAMSMELEPLEAPPRSQPAAPAPMMVASAPAPQLPRGSAGEDEQRPFLGSFSIREAPGWAMSLGVHLVLLFVLAGIRQVSVAEPDSTLIASIDELEQTQVFDAAMHDTVGTNSENMTLTASAASVATQAGQNPQNDFQEDLQKEVDVEVPVTEEMITPPQAEMTGTVNVQGGGTENVPGGTEGAIDRLTLELRSSLANKKTLVVWLFDASQSLRERRNSIAERFENVYKQLDAFDPNAEKSLKTAVATFGEKTTILTKEPVDDVRSIIPKVQQIPDDVSGKENVFAAVGQVVRDFQRYRQGRNMLVFIVTDERGDDIDKIEDTIHQARRYGVKCFTVGNASLFGREKGYVRWKYPDDTEEDIEVDLGPETIAPEAIQLAFWGNSQIDYSKMSSGYGPYGLTRLCKETGGMFYIAEEGQGPKFNPAIMRNYQPDYRPVKEYTKLLDANKAKASVVIAATKTKVDSIPTPRLIFRADTDNVFREELTEAQKPAALVDAKVNEMTAILSVGEKDREKIKEPRWRAAYDLAMGRALAMRVRYFGYNTVLTEMKGLPKSFTKKENNQWRLVPSKTIAGGPAVKKLEKQASMYLKRVVDDHPGTPWAMLAERELAQPMGWDWQEASADYVKMDRDQAAAKQIRLADDEKKKEAAKKGMKIPEKAKPKL